MSRIVIDIEANGFLFEATKIHCLVAKEIETGIVSVYSGNDLLLGLLTVFQPENLIIGHNILGYDLPLIHKIYGLSHCMDKCIDTNLWSRLLNPDRKGGHSLESYGEEFGIKKEGKGIDNWETLTDTMIERCKSDVLINEQLYFYLEKMK